MWLNLERTVDKREVGQLKNVITLQTAMTKKGRQFFSGINRGDTVSCRPGWHPGDTNPSDVTGNSCYTDRKKHHTFHTVCVYTKLQVQIYYVRIIW